ncbi:MAG: hypothetical protein EHM42_12420 [Planctomycetaceae bacterium]|nr:MAG: hypothetical protein EHM42_12420 [Planctomycetaceae bacterium]
MVATMQQRTLGGGSPEPLVIPVCPVSMGLPLFPGAIPNQTPFAVILGCSDARVPTEAVFDQSFNDLFVLRIAGNVLGAECLGSLHYAVKHLADSLKLVVVLGHSKCGAVQAAVDTYLSPTNFADIAYTYALRSLVDQIQIAVRGSDHALKQEGGAGIVSDPDYRALLVATTVYVNAAVSALELRRELRLRGSRHAVVFGAYDFETLRIRSLPGAVALKAGHSAHLRRAPADPEGLIAYASEAAAALLAIPPVDRANSIGKTTVW